MDTQKIIEEFFEGTPFLVRGKSYHSPLPEELAGWYCYTSDAGHSILCQLEGNFNEARPEWTTLYPCPVKGVLRGYRTVRGFVVADIPYDSKVGLLANPEDDEY